ncbi:MAG: hypothetical protein ABI539_06380 [Acidobacteriota bacterium]
MAKLNWEIIGYNLTEAREQLEAVEKRISDGDPPSEGEFQGQLEHALHHLAYAWNIRRVSTKQYTNVSDKDFNEWSKFPPELEPFPIEK